MFPRLTLLAFLFTLSFAGNEIIFKEELKLFARCTFTYATTNYQSGNIFLPLVPKNKLNLALVFKRENKFKVGLEGYFADRQYLYYGNKTPSFWKFGFMAEKTFNKVVQFINFENFTAQRQSNYKRVVNPPYNDPTFDDIWNYTEGFIVNGESN
ncbi:MAG: hypothetical protein H7320_22715 [Ferruginibacter sp.]|nr:hypothetical protein [Ferruginibacter sp.]